MAVRLTGTGQTYTTLLAAADSIRAIGSLVEDEIIELTDNKNYDWTTRNDLDFGSVALNGNLIRLLPSPGVRFTVSLDPADPYNVSLMTFTGARIQAAGDEGLYIAHRLNPIDMLFVNDVNRNVFNNSTTNLTRCICITQPGATQNFRMGGGNPAAVARASIFINGDIGVRFGRNTNELNACTVLNAVVGIDTTFGSLVTSVQDNVTYDCTTGWVGVFGNASDSNNASEDGSHPGIDGVTVNSNPFESDNLTPTLAGQLGISGIPIVNIPLDSANNLYDLVTPSIGGRQAQPSQAVGTIIHSLVNDGGLAGGGGLAGKGGGLAG